MSSSNQDIAYLVPKSLWERTLQEAKKSQQSGGALVGIDKSGDVDSKKLMHMMAIQQNMNQAPNLHFVGHADQLMKQILKHPHLSNEDKVQFLTSAQDAYERQRRGSLSVDDLAKPPPPPPPPPPTPLPPAKKLSYFTPVKRKPITTPTGNERTIKLIEQKMAQIDQSPHLQRDEKKELKSKLELQLRKLRSGREY